jgi:hypothetical protein
MPGGSVTKIERTYKKWTYIARKQNIQLTTKQHVHLRCACTCVLLSANPRMLWISKSSYAALVFTKFSRA